MPIFARVLVLALGLAGGLLPLSGAVAAPPPGPVALAAAEADPQPDPAPPAGPAIVLADDPGPANDPTVSLGPAAVAEGDVGATTMSFPISLSAPCPGVVELTYDVVPSGTYPTTPGVDHEAVVDGTFAFAPGVTDWFLEVLVHGDVVPEPDETLVVVIHDVDGCAVLPGGQVSAVGTILNDDVQHVSIDDVSVVEGDAGTTDMVFTVSLDAPALIDYSVSIGYGPGTATPDVDWVFAPLPSPLVFLEGTQSIEVTVEVIGDTEVEDDETLALSLHHASFGLEIDKGLGIGTIIDDDAEEGGGDDGGSDGGDDGGSDGGDDGGSDGTEVLDDGQERGSLPRTGVTVGGLALLGAALVAGGRAVTALSRR